LSLNTVTIFHEDFQLQTTVRREMFLVERRPVTCLRKCHKKPKYLSLPNQLERSRVWWEKRATKSLRKPRWNWV